MEPVSASVAVAVGIVIPFLVSFLKDVTWSAKSKQALSLVISLAAAGAIAVFDGGVTATTLVANLGVIFTTAQAFYIQYFESTKVNMKLEESGIGGK